MKNLKISLFVLFTTLLFVQCEKKDDGDNTTNGPSISAVVDGNSWVSASATATTVQGLLNISGIAADGSYISITISDNTVGKYTLNQQSSAAGTYTKSAGSISFTTNALPTGSGEIEITSIDTDNKLISGKFHFHGVSINGSVEVTEGNFTNIELNTELPTYGDNSLTVDIDGNTFTPGSVSGLKAGGKLIVNAAASDLSKSLSINVSPTITVGEYTIGSPYTMAPVYVLYNPTANGTEAQGSESGTLNITKHDTTNKRIEGTFSCTTSALLGGSATLTNGKFSCSY